MPNSLSAESASTRSKKTRRYSLVNIFSTISGIILTAFMLFPLYWMLINSFETTQEMFSIPVALFPSHLTLDPYISVLQRNCHTWARACWWPEGRR